MTPIYITEGKASGQACVAMLLNEPLERVLRFMGQKRVAQRYMRAVLRAGRYEIGPRRKYRGKLPKNALLRVQAADKKHWMLMRNGEIIDPCRHPEKTVKIVLSYFALLGRQLELLQ